MRHWIAALLFALPTVLGPDAARSETHTAASGPAAMGIGLAGVADWSPQAPFLDMMKTARPWIGHRPGQWGGVSESELILAGLIDDNGWPTRIPTELRGIGTIILADLPAEAETLAGRYRLSFDGDGIVEVSGNVGTVRYGDGRVEFDYTPGPGHVVVTINRSDRRNSGDYLRNISIVKLDHLEAFAAGQIFNPDWIARIETFGTLRFMDWMHTNNSLIRNWDDRPLPDDSIYARDGVPLEVMIDLANQLGSDPWFNMPHRADDAYIRAFAEKVRDTLDPSLMAYVEFSNEVWNWQFEQAVWAEDAAKERWGQEYRWMQQYGIRSAETAQIWKDVYGTEADTRLTTVISTQTGWIGLEVDALEAPLFVDEAASNATPVSAHDAYAVSGYFGGRLGSPDFAPTLRGWIDDSRATAVKAADDGGLSGADRVRFIETHQYDQAIAMAVDELRDGVHSGDANDTIFDLGQNVFPYHAEVAKRHGLDLVMYEGGSHIVGTGAVLDDDALTDFFVALNYAPEMGALYTDLLTAWQDAGGTLFNAYADVQQPTKWGSWGHLRHLSDSNPRWDALMGFK